MKSNMIGYAVGILLFLLIAPFLMYLISVFFVLPIANNFVLKILSAFFILLGVIFMLWSNIYMAKIGKGCPTDGFNVSLGERTKNLMIAGPYKYSRNPMLFGTFIFYAGVALSLNSYSALLLPVIFISYMIWHVKKFEEPRLYKDFGGAYLEYKKTVSMIIPYIKRP